MKKIRLNEVNDYVNKKTFKNIEVFAKLRNINLNLKYIV